MYDITALGELLVDFVGQPGETPTYAALPGGAPANVVCAAARYGCTTAFIGKVGADDLGQYLLRTLQDYDVDCHGVIKDPAVFTTLAFVSLDKEGERSFSFARKPGADACLEAKELNTSILHQTRMFHFGSISMTGQPCRNATITAVKTARQAGAILSFDPNMRDNLWDTQETAREQIIFGLTQADIVKMSLDELIFIMGEDDLASTAKKAVARFDLSLLLVTLGEKGCHYCTPTLEGTVATQRIQPLDTTGAGDIFTGAVLSQLAVYPQCIPDTQKELEQAIRFGNIAAGLSTQKHGGIPSIPSLEQVMAQLS